MARQIAAILSLDVVGFTARMAANPDTTMAELNQIFEQVIRPSVKIGNGRIFKLMGDGALVRFGTATEAIATAHAIQKAMLGKPVQLRAGVHVGDVTINGEDVFGDAVNIASRLQAAASPGGCLISRVTRQIAGGTVGIPLKSEGAMSLKGLSAPLEVLSLDLSGADDQAERARQSARQLIRFATSRDGTRIAWTETGKGRTLVKAPNWVQHLEYDWTQNPMDGWLPHLSNHYRLIRCDGRNNGLSDRGVQDVSFDRFVDDLKAMFDAAGLERAPVFGVSLGAAVAAAFAARHPDRVSSLILMSGFVKGLGKRNRPQDLALGHAMMDLSRDSWDDGYPSGRHLFAQAFFPESSPQDQDRYARFIKMAMTHADYLRVGDSVDVVDIEPLLPDICCPALVLHSDRERLHFKDQGQRLAAGIRNARFVSLDTANNTMPDYDPEWPRALREIEDFLSTIPDETAPG
ncbi:alpha/beta fold hydrolase [Ruegeria pomeroyi]|nr:alpha/beta fold hydrolase [Ruegeria pomeroyi]MCE8528587.1 alpha/beta fold hydrolase [Ruegeria pomeroyi]